MTTARAWSSRSRFRPERYFDEWLNEEYARGNVGLRIFSKEFDALNEGSSFSGETTVMNNSQIPDFDFVPPKGYRWLIERGLVGFDETSPLQPWHYLPKEWAFDLSEEWPDGPEYDLSDGGPKEPMHLFAFAKRQDNDDDLACFEVVGGRTNRVVLVHGWTSRGYGLLRTFDTFWEWLKDVIDDIEEWVDPPEDDSEAAS